MKSLILFLLFVLSCQTYCQSINSSVIANGGDYLLNSQVFASWTIGEPVTGTIQNNSYCFTQGFQQSRIFLTPVDENLPDKCFIKAYPIPASNQINLDWKFDSQYEIIIEIFDNSGKSVLTNKVNPLVSPYSIDISDLSAGSYLLIISSFSGKKLKTIKIVKIY
ncbi:MAG: T9SS type A sorting domain-containing protein [Bacteroidota bacterium]